MTYKLFIIEDHPVMRSAYKQLIKREPDFEVCGEAESGFQALELIPRSKPDLILVDVSLPGMNGLELINRLHRLNPGLPALVISGHEEALYAQQALQAGARGYLVKTGLADIMVEAIRDILHGDIYLSDELREELLR